MNLNNWLYLAAGLALGAGLRGLFRSPAKQLSHNGNKNEVVEKQESVKNIQQIELAYYLAQEMSQFKAGFLARTTHVLRSPLNGLIGLHQLILSDLCESPEEEREFIEQAHERAMKLLKLIDEILNIARVEYGTNRLDIQPQPLIELLQEVYDLTYLLAENRNYPFSLELPEQEIYVTTDVRWLRQVLISLIDTTISQMEAKMEEGRICISVPPTQETGANCATIWLDMPTFAFPSSEAIDLMTTEMNLNLQSPTATAPGMKLLLSQSILDVLGGKLEILPYPDDGKDSQQMTRLQISIPQTTPEVGLVQ
ncbi:HAMP domain-containing sensor histidine kinase [Calothrix sp. UHCC 0171]|uniref:sensor histidine kinase n=1 Tax=Calothrix sp. UHCC 0171 TaxID=3110245 RepID=UPI002B1EFFBF|nr:HAMP domain-containing sensor histidine kinase [Calothrix sp. UHCC 0171]MEA5572375.1 HAMP domain-containing sensor histidine kinase [Calothrix sp. UHCC 0171]